MTISANPLLIHYRTSLLIEKLKTNPRSPRRERIHLEWIALPQLVFLDFLLRAQPVLKPIRDRIRVIRVQMTKPARPSVPLPLTATLNRPSRPYYPLFEKSKHRFAPGYESGLFSPGGSACEPVSQPFLSPLPAFRCAVDASRDAGELPVGDTSRRFSSSSGIPDMTVGAENCLP